MFKEQVELSCRDIEYIECWLHGVVDSIYCQFSLSGKYDQRNLHDPWKICWQSLVVKQMKDMKMKSTKKCWILCVFCHKPVAAQSTVVYM